MELTEQSQGPAGGPQTLATIGQDDRVTQAARVMHANRVGCLAVLGDHEALVGILSERDILRWLSTGTAQSFSARVKDIMTRQVVTCAPGITQEDALRLMVQHRIRHLPVVENGRLVGMISSRDLMAGQVHSSE